MSIASQQRVIEEKDAKITALKRELAQEKADKRALTTFAEGIITMADARERAGVQTLSIPIVRLFHKQTLTPIK